MNINKRAIGPDWLAVDWGTSHLRIWLLNAQGHILAEACDDSGMAALSSDQFYARLKLIRRQCGHSAIIAGLTVFGSILCALNAFGSAFPIAR